MATPGTRAMFAGLAILLFLVSAGFNSGTGGFGLLLCFAGVIAGANIVTLGMRMSDNVPAVLAEARALGEFLRRNPPVLGLVMASGAVTLTAISGEAGQVLCFSMFALLLLGLSLIRAAPTPMSTRGSSRAMYAGLIILLLAVGAGINLGDCDGLSGPPLSFMGVVAGVNMIAAGVRTADDPAAPIGPVPAAFAGAHAFMGRNLAVVGLVMVSSACTAVAGETVPALSFVMFVLLVLGVSLINIGVHGA